MGGGGGGGGGANNPGGEASVHVPYFANLVL